MTDAEVERLARLDGCLVSDAGDALGIDGVATGLVPMWEGARLVGRAVTVRLEPAPAPRDTPPVHLGVAAIARSGPGDVIVVDNAGRTGMGGWGGLLSAAAVRQGVEGVVLDGALRDVDEARELRFPVFAVTRTVRTARGRVYEAEVGGRVSVGGIPVETGDLVLADGSGVVVVRAADAEAVLAKAEDLARREAEMQLGLREGLPPATVLGPKYERMLHSGRSGDA
jgi:4-hydroxy-4-methyl-2-oxoglutarate aldolase